MYPCGNHRVEQAFPFYHIMSCPLHGFQMFFLTDPALWSSSDWLSYTICRILILRRECWFQHSSHALEWTYTQNRHSDGAKQKEWSGPGSIQERRSNERKERAVLFYFAALDALHAVQLKTWPLRKQNEFEPAPHKEGSRDAVRRNTTHAS